MTAGFRCLIIEAQPDDLKQDLGILKNTTKSSYIMLNIAVVITSR